LGELVSVEFSSDEHHGVAKVIAVKQVRCE
jgi:hypothetical protein